MYKSFISNLLFPIRRITLHLTLLTFMLGSAALKAETIYFNGEISMAAKGIPFSISCGEDDTSYSVKGYAHTRVEWYKLFAKELEKKVFVFTDQTWPGVGHGVSSRLYGAQLKDCFLLATKVIVPTSGFWKGDVAGIAKEVPDTAFNGAGNVEANDAEDNALGDEDRATFTKANQQIAAVRAPDVDATIRFLLKYPAASWVSDKSLDALKKHCRNSALKYLEIKKNSGEELDGEALIKFRKIIEGLDM